MSHRKMRLDVFQGKPAPHRWFWRLVWANGQIAATSEGYARKGTAIAMAQHLADKLGVLVTVKA